jgi:hypothetical protein
MPAEQKGSTYFTAKGAGVRWIENGRRRKQSGFKSKTEARQWWNAEVAPRLRRGVSTSEISLTEHVDRYLRVHLCSEARRRTLRSQLGVGSTPPKGSALEVFGKRGHPRPRRGSGRGRYCRRRPRRTVASRRTR